jgi:hypothetical protein
MKKRFLLFQVLMIVSMLASAQTDTLPGFTVTNAGNNRFIVGWVNNYGMVKQISIQRSHDSLKDFKTILSMADPNARQNGFVDSKAPNDHMYYRLFVVLDKGQYFFTEAKQPFLDTATNGRLTKNSMIENTRDSLAITLKPVVPKKPEFVPSFYVYTNRDGYVFINLPDAARKKYRIRFFEEDDSFLFEIKTIREPALTLDKTNFLHAGWFKFELYDEEKLVEKNKFYLAREF